MTVKDYPKMVALTLRSEVFLLNWDAYAGDSALKLLSVVDLGKPGNRCNDGKVDAKGRLWFGKSKLFLRTNPVYCCTIRNVAIIQKVIRSHLGG